MKRLNRKQNMALAGRGAAIVNPFKQWFPWLFDFSQGEQENQNYARILTGILQVALAESETDAEFERRFRQLMRASNGLAEEHTWAWLNHRLRDYRSAGEFTPMPRTLATRFLRDIPHRYGVKASVAEASANSVNPPAT